MSTADATPCRWCGQHHGPRCPIVKALEFDSTGVIITRVEFVTDADAPPDHARPWPYNHPGMRDWPR